MIEAGKELGENALVRINTSIDEIDDGIETLVSEYWQKWRAKNKYLETIEKIEGKYLRGSIAPRKYSVSDKTYVEWYVYPPGRYGGRSRSWGDRIKPRTGPRYYTEQFVSRSQEWELAMIEETENKLRPLRYMYEALRKSKVRIERAVRNIED
jgi:hypothetical protein